MATLIIPNSFTANTAISSSEMNANFSAITTLINSTKLNSDNIQTSGIATANLADSSVTRAKLASGALKDNSDELSNLAISASVGSSALTVALKGKDGNDPSASNIVLIGFRSSTAASGVYVQRSITSAVSLTVPSGATLGSVSAKQSTLYVVAIDDGGTIRLGICGSKFLLDEGTLISSTLISTGADSDTVLYSDPAVTSKAFRVIGRITSTQATAGTWATTPSEVSIIPLDRNREAIAVVSGNPAGANADTAVIWPTVDIDLYGNYNSTTGEFTCKYDGFLQCNFAFQIAEGAVRFRLYVDGSMYRELIGQSDSGTGNTVGNFCVNVKAGSVITIRPVTTNTTTYQYGFASFRNFAK